jgi:transcriptional regulator with XRE-family HTH domain
MTNKYGKNVITGTQIRGARAMLGWSAKELAERAAITRNTVQRLESFNDIPPSRTQSLVELQRVFEEAGIEFIGAEGSKGPGVRLARWPSGR